MDNLDQKYIDELKQAIKEIETGYIGTAAARIRYNAAVVSRFAIDSKLPRHTKNKWDLYEYKKEHRKSQRWLNDKLVGPR